MDLVKQKEVVQNIIGLYLQTQKQPTKCPNLSINNICNNEICHVVDPVMEKVTDSYLHCFQTIDLQNTTQFTGKKMTEILKN